MITKQNSLNFMVFLYSFDFYFKLRWLNMVSLFLNSNIFDEIYYLHFLSVPLNMIPKNIQLFLNIFVTNFHSITLNFTC